MSALTAVFVIVVVIWLWADTLRAREGAFKACTRTCRQMDVQLLDQTVQLASMGLGRTDRGMLSIRRHYGFEFSVDGVERRQGSAAMLGAGVEYVQLDHPDGMTIVEPHDRKDRKVF